MAFYVLCDKNCKYESMSKEQILTAIEQAVNNGEITDVDAGFITKIKEKNANAALSFWVGTQAQYNAIEEKVDNCFYIITDDTTEDDIFEIIKDLQTQLNTVSVDFFEENGEKVDPASGVAPAINWRYSKRASGLVEIWGESEAFKLSTFKYFTVNLPLALKQAPLHINYGTNLNVGLTETADERSYKDIRVLTRYALNDRINVYFGNDSGETFNEFKFSINVVGSWK